MHQLTCHNPMQTVIEILTTKIHTSKYHSNPFSTCGLWIISVIAHCTHAEKHNPGMKKHQSNPLKQLISFTVPGKASTNHRSIKTHQTSEKLTQNLPELTTTHLLLQWLTSTLAGPATPRVPWLVTKALVTVQVVVHERHVARHRNFVQEGQGRRRGPGWTADRLINGGFLMVL